MKKILVAFGLAALTLGLVGCGQDAAVATGPDSVSGINRNLSPLYFRVSPSPLKDTYSLFDHPVLTADLFSVDSAGVQDKIKIDPFQYPVTWTKCSEAAETNCAIYNKIGFSAQVRCNVSSGLTPYKFCIDTVIDARPIHGEAELIFQ
jgi:hypothetical protein